MTELRAGIADIGQSIWRTVVGLPLAVAEEPWAPGEPTVTCFVQVEGAWEGAVVLRCSEAMAGLLAAAMFDGPGPPEPDEVVDAMGEITNIMAGNIKALLPQPCRITLPIVALGSDYRVQVLRTTPVAEAAFTYLGDTLVVTVLKQSDPFGRQ